MDTRRKITRGLLKWASRSRRINSDRRESKWHLILIMLLLFL